MRYLKNLGNIELSVLALILASTIWGAAFPIYKWSLQEVPPFTFSFIRFFAGALILLPFVIKDLKIVRSDYRNLLILSIVSVTIQIPLLYFGLRLTPSINAPIIIAMGPIILIIASIIFLKEKPKSKVIAGTIISLLGVFAIIIRPLLESGLSGGLLGNLLIFGATICSVIQIIILKKLIINNKPLTVIFWSFLIGSLPLFPFVIWESQTFNIVTDITIKGLIGILYGIYMATIAAHLLLVFGAKYIRASEIGIFSYVDPIATIVVAVPLLNEQITPAYLVGSLLVFLGIFIAEGRLHYHPIKKLLISRN